MKLGEKDISKGIENVLLKGLQLEKNGNQSLGIFTDEGEIEIADRIFNIAESLGIDSNICYIPKKKQKKMGKELTPHVKNLVLGHSFIITPLSADMDPKATAFRQGIIEFAPKNGRSLGHMPGITEKIFGLYAKVNIQHVKNRCESLGNILAFGKKIVLKTGDEDQFEIEIAGWDCLPCTSMGVIPRNGWGNLPSGEVFIEPPRNKNSGTINVNGAIPGEIIEDGDDFCVKVNNQGRVVEVSPPKNPHTEYIHSKIPLDLNYVFIEEFGIGMVDMIKPHELTGNMLIDEKVLGTSHIAISTKKGAHMDLVSTYPTIIVDDKVVMKKGHLEMNDHKWFALMLDNIVEGNITHIKVKKVDCETINESLFRIWQDLQGNIHRTKIGPTKISKTTNEIWQLIKKKKTKINVSKLIEKSSLPESEVLKNLAIMKNFGIIECYSK